jgi:pyocin large subunit-like protein
MKKRVARLERLCRQLGWFTGLLLLIFASQACRQASAPAREVTAPSPISAQPAAPNSFKVRTEIGFASRQKFLEHYQKHGREFGDISAEEYLLQAQKLRERPAGKEVLEVVRSDSVITRYDKTTGAFLAFNQDLTIRTFFKPNDGVNYFWRQNRR